MGRSEGVIVPRVLAQQVGWGTHRRRLFPLTIDRFACGQADHSTHKEADVPPWLL